MFIYFRKMFASVKNIDIYEEDFPLFLSIVLLPKFDPSHNFENFPSHIYNELPNDLFVYFLHQIIKNEVGKPVSSRKEDWKSIDKKSIESRFFEEYDMDLNKMILRPFLTSTLFTKWNYALRDFYIARVHQHKYKSHYFLLYIKSCLHKEECAYGKVVEETVLVDVKKKRDFVVSLDLEGIVPQQNIIKDMMFLPA